MRLNKAVQSYERIQAFFDDLAPSAEFSNLVGEFDRRLPEFAHFTATKKFDTLLWQWRPD